MTVAELVTAPAPAESLAAPADSVGARVPPEPEPEVAEPEIVAAPQPVPVAPLYEAQAFERPIPAELPVAPSPERRRHAEMVAAFMAPLNTAAFEEAHIGDFDVISVSTAGMQGSMVAAAAGRLSLVIARGMPQPIEQVTLRGLGGTLVLTPVGSGWSSGTTLAVGTRPGSALARLEMLARRATRHARESPAVPVRSGAPLARLEATAPPPAVTAAAEALTIFGPLAAQSFRDPASGAVVHCLVSPGTVAADLASFACELAQAMAQNAPAEALGVFHSAVLRSGSTRVEIRRLPSAAGLTLILVVGGIDTGRPGLARLQVERTAARLSVA
jgi:predicted regulator of Ras-like GTPase activity (Roadblock/LC7/MglB family)